MNGERHCDYCGAIIDTRKAVTVVDKDGAFCSTKCSNQYKDDQETKRLHKQQRELKNEVITLMRNDSPAHAHAALHRYLAALGYNP